MSDATDKRCLSSSDTTQTSHASPPKKVKHCEDVSSSEEDCSISKWSTGSQDGHGIKENFPSADVNFTDKETQSQDGARFAVVTADRIDRSGSKGMDIEQSLRVIGDSSSQDSKAETLGACSTGLDKKSDKETCCEFQNKVQDKDIVTDKARCCHLTDVSKTWTSVQQPQTIPDQVRDAHGSGKISGGQVGSNNDIKISSLTKVSDGGRNLNFKNNDVSFEQERTAEASDLRASENSQTGTCVKEIEVFEESFESHYSSVYTTTSSDYTDSSDDDLVIDLDDDNDGRKGDEDALHEIQPNRRQDLQCASGTSKSSKPVGYTAAKLLKLPLKTTDPDEIDAFQREKYVMFLMQTLKSNVFYDSFCYAFPKRKQIEDSYKYKVKSISDFMEHLRNKELSFSPAVDFPTSASLYQAEGFIEDMKKRYVISEEDAGIEKCDEEEEDNAEPDDDQRQTQGCPASQCTEFDTLTGCPDQRQTQGCPASQCTKFDTLTGCPDQRQTQGCPASQCTEFDTLTGCPDQRQTQGCPASQCTEFDTLTGCPDQRQTQGCPASQCTEFDTLTGCPDQRQTQGYPAPQCTEFDTLTGCPGQRQTQGYPAPQCTEFDTLTGCPDQRQTQGCPASQCTEFDTLTGCPGHRQTQGCPASQCTEFDTLTGCPDQRQTQGCPASQCTEFDTLTGCPDQRQTQGCPASQCTKFDTLTGCPDQEGNPAIGSNVCGKTEPGDDTSGTCSNSGGKSGTTETSGDSSESSTSKDMTKALEKEMDNDVPHHTVFVVGGQNGCVKSSWAGQFLLTVNPVTNSLLMKLFTYAPDYDEEVCQSFADGKFTEKVWHEMRKNLHMFELSRQLCVSMALDSVASVKMMVSESDDSEGVIWLHCKATPTFHQRFIHTTASLLNQWQPRESFWSDVATVDPPYDLCLGGTTEELSAIMALIVTCEPRLKRNTDTETSEYSNSQTCSELRKCDRNEMFHNEIHGSRARMQRSEILRILLDHQLISQNHYNEMLEDEPPLENKDINKNREINILEGLSDFHECFSDYISFHCADVSELENRLSAPLNASAYGFSPGQFDFNCTMAEQDECNTTTDGTSSTEGNSRASPVDKLPDIDTMKVADFLCLQKSPSVFYSFCTGCLQEDSHTWHCGVCRKCVSWRTWHCVRCNNCSRGTSDSVCEFCGSYGFDRTIIKPLSMFAEELRDDQCSPTNQRWNITVSKDDIIHWPDPCKDLDQTADHPDIPFRLKEMMSDHLGLIDPVAFLLGTSARGIESRHERIRLKYKKKEKPTAQLPCVIQ